MKSRLPIKRFWKIKEYLSVQIFDRKTKKKERFVLAERGRFFWKVISFKNKKVNYLSVEELESNRFFYTISEFQMLIIWSNIATKPLVISAKGFARKLEIEYYYSNEQRTRLVFMAEDPNMGQLLIDNGQYWLFNFYGEPFYVFSHLACPVRLDSGDWTIAIEQFIHPFFRAKNMPTDIQVAKTPDQRVHLFFKNPDNEAQVVLYLSDYKLKLRPID